MIDLILTPLREGDSWDSKESTVGSRDYSCNFGFQQRYEEYTDLPGVDSSFAGGELIDASDSEPYFVVAGSNNVRPLRVSTSNVTSPGQDTLQDAANNAEKVVTGEPTPHPFTHFPGQFADPDIPRRDPNYVWDQDYNN